MFPSLFLTVTFTIFLLLAAMLVLAQNSTTTSTALGQTTTSTTSQAETTSAIASTTTAMAPTTMSTSSSTVVPQTTSTAVPQTTSTAAPATTTSSTVPEPTTTTTAPVTTTSTAAPETTTSSTVAPATTTTTTILATTATDTPSPPATPAPPTPVPAPRQSYDMQVDPPTGILRLRPSGSPGSAPWGYASAVDLGAQDGPINTARALCKMANLPWRGALYSAVVPPSTGSLSYMASSITCRKPSASSSSSSSPPQSFTDCDYSDSTETDAAAAQGKVLAVHCMTDPNWSVALGPSKQIIIRKGNTSLWGAACTGCYSSSSFYVIARTMGAPTQGWSRFSIQLSSAAAVYKTRLATCLNCMSSSLPAFGECRITDATSSSSCSYAWGMTMAGTSGVESRYRMHDYVSSHLPNIVQHRITTALPEHYRPLCSSAASDSGTLTFKLMCANFTGRSPNDVGNNFFVAAMPFNRTGSSSSSSFTNEFGWEISPISSVSCSSSTKGASWLDACYQTAAMSVMGCSTSSLLSLACEPTMEWELQEIGTHGASSPQRIVRLRPGSKYPWGSMAVLGAQQNSAAAICKKMGHVAGSESRFFISSPADKAAAASSSSSSSSWAMPVYGSGIRCAGPEGDPASLVQCPMSSPAPDSVLGHNNDAGVLCVAADEQLGYSVSIDGASGVLYVAPAATLQSNGATSQTFPSGVLCKSSSSAFDDNTAKAVCAWAGKPTSGATFTTVDLLQNPPNGGSSSLAPPVYLSSLHCPAGAKNLSQCEYSDDVAGASGCDASSAVALVCVPKRDYQFRVSGSYKILEARPVPASPGGGAIEPWGTVCAKQNRLPSDSYKTAEWICKSIGLPFTGARFRTRAAAAPGTGSHDGAPTYLQEVSCPLPDPDVPVSHMNFSKACVYKETSVGCTSHESDIVLECNKKVEYDFRPVCGSSYCDLRATPSSDPRTTPQAVCSVGFSTDSARNVCRLMGKPSSAATVWTQVSVSSSISNFAVSDLVCDDSTSGGLTNCHYLTNAVSGCTLGIRVYCRSLPTYTLSASNPYSIGTAGGGQPLVSTATSSTDSICAHGMTISTARQLCRMMGLPFGGARFWAIAASYTTVMSNLKCPFGAKKLSQCEFDFGGSCRFSSSMSSSYRAVLQMSCVAGPSYEYRLFSASGNSSGSYAVTSATVVAPPSSGQLQVRSSPSAPWSPVCAAAPSFAGAPAAAPLCGLLGFYTGDVASSSYTEIQQPASSSAPGWKVANMSCPPFAVTTADCSTTTTFTPCPAGGGSVVGLRCGRYVGVTAPPANPDGGGSDLKVSMSLSKQLLFVTSLTPISPQAYPSSTWMNDKLFFCPYTSGMQDQAGTLCRLLGYQNVAKAKYMFRSPSGVSGTPIAFGSVSCPNTPSGKITTNSSSSSSSSSSSFSKYYSTVPVSPSQCSFAPPPSFCKSSSSTSSRSTGYVTAIDCHSGEYFRDGFFFKYVAGTTGATVDGGPSHKKAQAYTVMVRRMGEQDYKYVDGSRWGADEVKMMCAMVGRPNAATPATVLIKKTVTQTILDDLRCPGTGGNFLLSKCSFKGMITSMNSSSDITPSTSTSSSSSGSPKQISVAYFSCRWAKMSDSYEAMLDPNGRVLLRSATSSSDTSKASYKFCTYSMSSRVPLVMCRSFGYSSSYLNTLRYGYSAVYTSLPNDASLRPVGYRLTCPSSRSISFDACSYTAPSSSSSRKGSYCFSSSASYTYDLALDCNGLWQKPGVNLNISSITPPGWSGGYAGYYPEGGGPGLIIGVGVGIFCAIVLFVLVIGWRINQRNKQRLAAANNSDSVMPSYDAEMGDVTTHGGNGRNQQFSYTATTADL